MVQRIRVVVALACLAALPAQRAIGALVSEDSAFGTDTITHDTTTDLRWLDLTESIGYSHDGILAALEPGGAFEGYRLATANEVTQLFTDAGIDVSAPALGVFVTQNYDPIVALTALVGVVGSNGNCGTGCTFSYSQGFIDAPPPAQPPGSFANAGLAWFDNTAGLSPGDPAAPVGRVVLDGGHSGAGDPFNAAWLVVPEPDAAALGATALLALVAARRARHREA